MPEFQLNKPRKPFAWHFDAFAEGYLEAMFFTNGDSGDDDEMHLNSLGTQRLTRASVLKILRDCAAFQKGARELLDEAYQRDYDETQAGRDFWFTRQGHGVGFWDRTELDADDLGRKLSSEARKFGEIYAFAQRGWIYCE
jgi:hypothetical protein